MAAYRRLLLLLVSFVDRGIGSVVLLLPALALRLALYTLVLVSGFTRSLALLLGGALGLISLLSLLLSARVVYRILNLPYRALRDYFTAILGLCPTLACLAPLGALSTWSTLTL